MSSTMTEDKYTTYGVQPEEWERNWRGEYDHNSETPSEKVDSDDPFYECDFRVGKVHSCTANFHKTNEFIANVDTGNLNKKPEEKPVIVPNTHTQFWKVAFKMHKDWDPNTAINGKVIILGNSLRYRVLKDK